MDLVLLQCSSLQILAHEPEAVHQHISSGMCSDGKALLFHIRLLSSWLITTETCSGQSVEISGAMCSENGSPVYVSAKIGCKDRGFLQRLGAKTDGRTVRLCHCCTGPKSIILIYHRPVWRPLHQFRAGTHIQQSLYKCSQMVYCRGCPRYSSKRNSHDCKNWNFHNSAAYVYSFICRIAANYCISMPPYSCIL